MSLFWLLIVMVAVSGSAVMTAVLFWLVSRVRRLERADEAKVAGALTSHVEELRSELASVRHQLEQLEERTEFNARLLEGRGDE